MGPGSEHKKRKEEITMTHNETARKILENVGGNQNVTNYMSCMTRLRVEVSDKSKVDKAALESLEMVKGVTMAGNVVQIILLNELDKTYEEFSKIVDKKQMAEKKATAKDRIFGYLQGVFVPLVPILVVYGFLSGIITLIDTLGLVDPASTTHTILGVMKDAPLYFFPLYIAYTSAQYLGCNPIVSALMAGILMHPDMIGLSGLGQDFVSFFGLPVRAQNYASSVLPMLLSVFCVYYAEKLAKKILPDSLKFLTAFITVIVATPFALCIAAPLGSYITMLWSYVVNWLVNDVPLFAGIVIGALANLLVIVGMHTAVIPLIITDMVSQGQSCLVSLLYYGSVILAGMAFGAFFKTRSKEEKGFYLSSGVIGVLTGVVEPALYGIPMRFKKSMIVMIVIGAINGAAVMLLKISATAMANGVFGFPGFAHNMAAFIIVYLLSLVGAAVGTYLFGGIDEE